MCSLVVSLAPAEMEDFDVEVKASEETVRAGQPFNVTCVSPTGLGFQQQWLHPKTQARRETFPFRESSVLSSSAASSIRSGSGLSAVLPYFLQPRSPYFHVISFPAALSLKLANNGFGLKRGSSGSGI